MTTPLTNRALRLDYTPHEGQANVHDSAIRHRVVVAGRRWGKSELALRESLRTALEQPGSSVCFGSPVYQQARSRFRSFVSMCRDLPQTLVESTNRSELRVVFSNQSSVIFASLFEPDRIRGEGFDLCVVDECGYVDADTWTHVLRPTMSDRGGRALAIGSPRGRGQLLHVLFEKGQAGDSEWESFRFKTADSPLIPASEIEAARSELPLDVFRQEYQAVFLESAAGVFRCVEKNIRGELEPPRPGGQYVIGVDLAQTRDFTVLITIDVARRQVVDFQRVQGESYVSQVDRIIATAIRYNRAMVVIDETGVGKPVVDGVRASLGGTRKEFPTDRRGGVRNQSVKVQGIVLTSQSKQDLIQKLALDLERGHVHYPNIPELIRELQVYTYEMTRTGRVSYSAPSGMHDDTVISLALANFAITTELAEKADPILQRIDRYRNQITGRWLMGSMIGSRSEGSPIDSYLLDAARVRRRHEIGLITDEEYAALREKELPFWSYDEVWAACSGSDT